MTDSEPGTRELAGTPLEVVLAYHERTKHHWARHSRSLGYLDWSTQPNPFRLYEKSRRILLEEAAPTREPGYDELFAPRREAPHALDAPGLSQLLYDSLAISAWKEYQGSRWSLRANPSSGALHPTEAYLLLPAIPGVLEAPSLCHYAPFYHALEVRGTIDGEDWLRISEGLPLGSWILGLATIPWRESWKYGERAFRYCQHDAGHAIAGISLAAAVLGWETRLLESVCDPEAAALLGLLGREGPEIERADALLAIWPGVEGHASEPLLAVNAWRPAPDLVRSFSARTWSGSPNRLSTNHHPWPVIEEVSLATERRSPPADSYWSPGAASSTEHEAAPSSPRPSLGAREIFRGRRSAVSMDGDTRMSRASFFRLLGRLLPCRHLPPFSSFPWRPQIHLVLFIHRVEGLEPGLYFLARGADAAGRFQRYARRDFAWTRPEACPEGLDLSLLLAGDAREVARSISCHQEIASDGVFAVAMLAEYEGALKEHGPSFYRRLHWEAGAVGQMLYLEAEAEGLRGTGIGCFFDDGMHDLLGITDTRYQTLYHFTLGKAMEDKRLKTLPAYWHREEAAAEALKREKEGGTRT